MRSYKTIQEAQAIALENQYIGLNQDSTYGIFLKKDDEKWLTTCMYAYAVAGVPFPTDTYGIGTQKLVDEPLSSDPENEIAAAIFTKKPTLDNSKAGGNQTDFQNSESAKHSKKPIKKTIIIVASIVVVVLLTVCIGGWYFLYEKPHNDAVVAFNVAAGKVSAENAELIAAIDETRAVVEAGTPPLDTASLIDAETCVTTSRAQLREIPEAPQSTEDIISATLVLNEDLNYSSEIADLEKTKIALENSIEQMEQVTNPAEAFIIERLQGISSIVGVSAATEDNDPNGQLNKQGGYTAAIYFMDSSVNQEEVFGDSVMDKGTNGGGCIEVYATAEEAEARSTYLGAFDGSAFSSGSHNVVGTVLVRTSDKLTATQQSDLEKQIMDSLTSIS